MVVNFEKPPTDEVIELSADDLIEGEGDEESVIELSAADIIKEPSEDEYSLEALVKQNQALLSPRSLRKDVGVTGPAVEKPKAKPAAEYFEPLEKGDYEIVDDLPEPNIETVKQYQELMRTGGVVHVENEVSSIGENIEAWGETGPVRGMSHVYSVYEGDEARNTMDKCEDTVVFNRKANMIALGDGMGGMGDGDLAAKAFKKGMENIDFGDLSGKTEEEIRTSVFEKFKQSADSVDGSGGKITCSSIQFFKTVDGKNKAVIVNVGDSGIVRLGVNGKLEELGESDSLWNGINRDYGNIIDMPDNWAMALNGLRGSKPGVPDLEDYLKKLRTQSFAGDLKEKFNFHTVMNFVVADTSIDDEKRENILNLFKNINRKTTSEFSQITPNHIKIIDVGEGDQFILGSDGLFDNMDNNQLQEVMEFCDFSTPEGQAKAAEYIKSTHGNGVNKKTYHKPDDVSYAAIKFNG